MNYLADVVGRTAELAAIDELLDSLVDGPSALVLEGDAGVGKSTLLQAAIEEARRRDATVLLAVATPADASLPYHALANLFETIDRDALDTLPPPQRDAFDQALLQGSADADPRAVATAILTLLEEMGQEEIVLVAIDGMEWLDAHSARVVEFCARRLTGPIGLIGTRRANLYGELVLRHPERLHVLRLGPLDSRSLRHVVGGHVDRPLALSWLERVNEASGGNLNHALELARALPADGPPPPALLLPAGLEEIVETRLEGLSPGLEEALLAVAALAEPTMEVLTLALGPEWHALLDEAEDRGLVEFDGNRIRFTHPLLAIGIQARASLPILCRMHRRLGAVVTSVEDRARHLAYAQVMPDAVPALDEAARQLRARGEPAAAAELLELARGLGGHHELQVRAAEHHLDAGDAARAQTLLEDAIPELAGGRARAEAMLLLAEIRYQDGQRLEALTLLGDARAEKGVDDWLEVMIDLRIGFLLWSMGSVQAALEPAQAALSVAEKLADDALLSQALALAVTVDHALGLRLDEVRLKRALRLERPEVRTAGLLRPSLIAAFLYLRTGKLDEAKRLLEALAEGHRARGEDNDLAWTCLRLVAVNCWRGDLESASYAADQAVEHLLRLDTRGAKALALAARGYVDAYAGRVEEARHQAGEAMTMMEEAGWPTGAWRPLAALCFIDLSVGDYQAAADRLTKAALESALREPLSAGGAMLCGDAAEALIAIGRIDEAEALVTSLERLGSAPGREVARGLAARGRGLLFAAHGELAAAERALLRATTSHERLPLPVEHARSLLSLGRVQRRRRRRAAARASLSRAVTIFERVGCERWADLARAELAGIKKPAHASGRLTRAEERVARLAGSGLTNREVAATLYLSPKTVEVHLGRAYRKLGIRSRAELGAEMARRVQNSAPEDASQAA
jgi:DNA-binding CsgD family transcriptional regulator